MRYQIGFATSDAEAQLRGIFLESDMDLAGELHEHVVIRERDEVIGGGLLTQTGAGVFHLAVFAVSESLQGRGLGSLLLRDLIREPWRHSLNGDRSAAGRFTVTTMAKGKSAGFYRRNGFADCAASELADPYGGQCGACPDRESCSPVPLKYQGFALKPEASRG